jgi:hypothetical protein
MKFVTSKALIRKEAHLTACVPLNMFDGRGTCVNHQAHVMACISWHASVASAQESGVSLQGRYCW